MSLFSNGAFADGTMLRWGRANEGGPASRLESQSAGGGGSDPDREQGHDAAAGKDAMDGPEPQEPQRPTKPMKQERIFPRASEGVRVPTRGLRRLPPDPAE